MILREELVDFCINELDYDTYKKQCQYFEKLNEERHIVKDYDEIFNILVDIAWKYKKIKCIPDDEIDTDFDDTKYKKTILTDFMYNPIQRRCIDAYRNKEIIENDDWVNWHPIVIKIYKFIPKQRGYDYTISAAVVRDMKYKNATIPIVDCNASLLCDPIVISVCIDNVLNKKHLRGIMRHELVHAKQLFSTNKVDIINTPQFIMARCSPIEDFIFPKNNRYDKLGLYVYIFGEHEQDAFRNELYQVVMDMPKKRLQEYKNVFGTFNDIAINIINDYNHIGMIYLYDEIIELYKNNDYIYILLIAYYLKQGKRFNQFVEYNTKDYIQSLLDGDIVVDENTDDGEFISYIKCLMNFIMCDKRRYVHKLMGAIHEALNDRNFKIN